MFIARRIEYFTLLDILRLGKRWDVLRVCSFSGLFIGTFFLTLNKLGFPLFSAAGENFGNF
ncbi:unnamed protein product [Meloidogyne enterolobii]|uniref:Uncharacterized protein n=2 Tax=Meloidogyne enterolobii TaxID=390850 RepID=A0A6V7Y4S8_MELEN|nr:unnamed protein product [Meloidogyne enterolobii]